MDISHLWAAWPIPGPWRVAPLTGGTNNLVWRVDAADGQAYVLRPSRDLPAIPRIRYEAELLQALSQRSLPFRLPVPVKANNGDVIVSFEPESGVSAFASLFPLLPGKSHAHPPERNDLLSAAHAATMLALLDEALATLPDIALSNTLTSFGKLAEIHPLVPDPLAAVERLPIDREQVRQIQALLSEVIESVPGLYAQLPQQLLHRDYDPGNILFEQQRITAVLDFEFAGKDIRVLDLCVALSWWPIDLMGTGKEWGLIDALGAAYTRRMALSEEELLAIPAVLRLRDATSFVHRMGRYLAGMESDARMRDRVEHSLWREAWLSAHREILLAHVMSWD